MASDGDTLHDIGVVCPSYTVIDDGSEMVGLMTVRVLLALAPVCEVAVMVVLPVETGVMTPDEEMVATDVLLLCQVTDTSDGDLAVTDALFDIPIVIDEGTLIEMLPIFTLTSF